MPAEPRFPAPDPRDVDPRAVRRSFGRAAATYDGAAVLQREVGARLAERLDVVKLVPATILDAGSGTGEAIGELSARYPSARVVALDAALPMLQQARARSTRGRSLLTRLLGPLGRGGASAPAFVCADATSLPLSGVCVELVWSNLMLQWVNDLPRAFAEFRRVLKVGGLLTFTTFGPDTLKELARAFARVDGHTHVGRFVDMHDLGDMLVAAGFADPVMDQETVTLTWPSGAALLAELRQLGANVDPRRFAGLRTPRWRRRLAEALEAQAGADGRPRLAFEVVYGHAFRVAPRPRVAAETAVAVDDMRAMVRAGRRRT